MKLCIDISGELTGSDMSLQNVFFTQTNSKS